MKNYKTSGKILTFLATAVVASGEGVLLGGGGLFGVSNSAVAAGEEGVASLDGVYELPKTAADTPAAFATAYWDDDAKQVTTDATDNTKIGVFTQAYGAGVTAADIRLIPNV